MWNYRDIIARCWGWIGKQRPTVVETHRISSSALGWSLLIGDVEGLKLLPVEVWGNQKRAESTTSRILFSTNINDSTYEGILLFFLEYLIYRRFFQLNYSITSICNSSVLGYWYLLGAICQPPTAQ
jgi:hypothetical protein